MKTTMICFVTLLTTLPVWADETPTPLPATIVQGTATIAEEAPVGPYQQPEWTMARRFPTTRVYLQQQPGEVGVEQWVRAQYPRGEAPNYSFEEEVEVGLPHRFQFDLYEVWDVGAVETVHPVPADKVSEDCVSTELRWAFADWGKIPLNPTLYGEWTFRNHALSKDKYELKLLLGEDLAPRLHWGFNLVYEREVGGVQTTEYSASQGISYTVLDEKLSLGLEAKLESESVAGHRSPAPIEVDLGPSLQWRPTRNTHLDLVPLFGVTGDSPHIETWLVCGYDFGSGASRKSITAPVSTRSQ